ncbi:hypothetical protein CO154_02075, partial [Candidatus Pacearchaeota archaeon CG_4_9_14_3_um_filter_31_7]
MFAWSWRKHNSNRCNTRNCFCWFPEFVILGICCECHIIKKIFKLLNIFFIMSQEQVWDAIAESWNNFRQKPKQFAVEYSQNWSKGKILDIGSGNCRNLFPFAEKEFDCYGIDFSDEALKKAKQFCNKNKIKVNLKKADATSLPFKNKSFDYVLAIAIIHVIEKKENRTKVLSEIKRILKNNGRALITFWNKNPINLIFSKDEYVKWGKQ